MGSISVDEALLIDLKELAEKLGRPLEAVISDALQGYVDATKQRVDDVAASRAQLAAGAGVDIDTLD